MKFFFSNFQQFFKIILLSLFCYIGVSANAAGTHIPAGQLSLQSSDFFKQVHANGGDRAGFVSVDNEVVFVGTSCFQTNPGKHCNQQV